MAFSNNSKLVSEYDLTREPRPKLRETNSSEEEEEAIGAHLMYVDKILSAIKSREDKLSGDAKKKVLDFRRTWKEYFESDSDKAVARAELGVSQHNGMEGHSCYKVASDAGFKAEATGKSSRFVKNTGGGKGASAKSESDSDRARPSSGKKKNRRGRKKLSSSSKSSSRGDSGSQESEDSTCDSRVGDSLSNSETSNSGFMSNRGRGRDLSFIEVMRQFVSRTVPKQEAYDEYSGQDLGNYLEII